MKTLEILATFIVFVIIDSIYLTSMKAFFDKQVNLIQGSNIEMKFIPAVLCYISLVVGLYYFIIKERKSLFEAFLLGFVIYSVYEFTNWALFKNWKLTTVLMDTLWGSVLFTLTTAIIYYIFNSK